MNFTYQKSSFITWMVYLDQTHKPTPSWLVSSVGRALHRYRRGHGFKSRKGLNFFQVLFSTTRFSSVLSCEDLLISSLHRIANICTYLKSSALISCFSGIQMFILLFDIEIRDWDETGASLRHRGRVGENSEIKWNKTFSH